MSEFQHGSPFGEADPIFREKMEEFDSNRTILLDMVRGMSDGPGAPNYDLTTALIDETAGSFVGVWSEIARTTPDPDDARVALAQFWLTDDNDRVLRLRDIVSGVKLELLEEEEANIIVDGLYTFYDTSVEQSQRIKADYILSLRNHVYEALGVLHERFGAPDTEKQSIREVFDVIEGVAKEVSQDYKDGISRTVGFERDTDDLDKDIDDGMTAGVSLYTSTRSIKSEDGSLLDIVTHKYGTTVRYVCPDFFSLPGYMKEFIQELIREDEADDGGKQSEEVVPFTLEDLMKPHTNFELYLNCDVMVNSVCAFEFGADFELLIDGFPIAIPEHTPEQIEAAKSMPIDSEEMETFNSIFSPEEISEMALSVEELGRPTQATAFIEVFRQGMGQIVGASKSQKIELAQGLAVEIGYMAKQ